MELQPKPKPRRTHAALGLWVGAVAGAMLAALIVIAIDTGYEAQTLAGGEHLRDHAILIIVVVGAAIGGFVSTILGGSRYRP